MVRIKFGKKKKQLWDFITFDVLRWQSDKNHYRVKLCGIYGSEIVFFFFLSHYMYTYIWSGVWLIMCCCDQYLQFFLCKNCGDIWRIWAGFPHLDKLYVYFEARSKRLEAPWTNVVLDSPYDRRGENGFRIQST